KVEVINIAAPYLPHIDRKTLIATDDGAHGVEEFARIHFERRGYQAFITESVPMHVLFGLFMWLLVQDPLDSHVRLVGFGDRIAFDTRSPSQLLWTGMPDDFGTS